MTRARTRLAMLAVLGAASGSPALAQDTAIRLALRFDEATLTLLQGMNEWVTVSAYYFAYDAAADAPVEEDGSVYLGGETVQIYPADQTVTLSGPGAFPPGWTDAPQINVNVFTARFAAEDNLIWCDLVEGPVADVTAADNVISCTLIAG